MSPTAGGGNRMRISNGDLGQPQHSEVTGWKKSSPLLLPCKSTRVILSTVPPAGRASGSPSHARRGWGFSGEAELGVCASALLPDGSATMEPEKAVCARSTQSCRACVCTCKGVCVYTCFYRQVWTAVMCDFVMNIQILMHLCLLLLCMEMCK